MEPVKINYDTASIVLIVFVIIAFITNVCIVTIQTLIKDWWQNRPSLIVFLVCLMFLRNICYILPALAIKNKTLKIIGVILSSTMVLYLIYNSILTIS